MIHCNQLAEKRTHECTQWGKTATIDGRYEEQIIRSTECNRLNGWPNAWVLYVVWRLHRRCRRLRTNREDDIYRVLYQQIHRRHRVTQHRHHQQQNQSPPHQSWPASNRRLDCSLISSSGDKAMEIRRDFDVTGPRYSIMYRSLLNNAADRCEQSQNEIASVRVKTSETGQS